MTTTHAAALAAIESAMEVEEAATAGEWGRDEIDDLWATEHLCRPVRLARWVEPENARAIVLARALLRPALEGARSTLEQHRPMVCDWPDCGERDCAQCLICGRDWPCPDATAALALADLAAHVSEGGAK